MSVIPAMENISLWHERDISHSSVERNIGPDTTITLDFALNRLTQVLNKLIIYPDNMERNLKRLKGLINSQRVLLSLTQKGVSREEAYQIVQENAMKVWNKGDQFLSLLIRDARVAAVMSQEELEECFELGYHTKHINTIFKRVFED
tara:strand:- start:231 stop:671 length:441 start_codon:yes stop_codon:yes gene_type:complete